MEAWLALGFLAGVAYSLQGPVNAQLRAAVQDPLWATLLSFVVGTIAIVALIAGSRAPVPVHLPTRPWVWAGGLLGVFHVCAALLLVPRIGAGTMIGLYVAGQMTCALVLDQFGLIGVPLHVTTPLRLLGAALVVLGVLLLRRA
jgi:bacterial/archaeal transporter family-2 protein